MQGENYSADPLLPGLLKERLNICVKDMLRCRINLLPSGFAGESGPMAAVTISSVGILYIPLLQGLALLLHWLPHSSAPF